MKSDKMKKPMSEGTNRVPRETAKKGKVLLLPEVMNFIQQPNRVTNAKHHYNLMQAKIFAGVMFYLQETIKARLKGVSYSQLDLFQSKTDKIRLTIPMKDLTTRPDAYKEVRESAIELAGLVVELPGKDIVTGEEDILISGLMQFRLPKNSKYITHLTIELEKEVAMRLIEIEKNNLGIPVNYTRYSWEIVKGAPTLHTLRIYLFISAWKSKGGRRIKVQDLKDWLMIGDKYPLYKDFKRRVLIPAHEYLYEKADCWFNCMAEGFEERERKAVTHLNFKIIVPELKRVTEMRYNKIVEMLRLHFHFKDTHYLEIKGILDNPDNLDKLEYKIMDLNEAIQMKKNTPEQVNMVASYVVKSLLNFFKL